MGCQVRTVVLSLFLQTIDAQWEALNDLIDENKRDGKAHSELLLAYERLKTQVCEWLQQRLRSWNLLPSMQIPYVYRQRRSRYFVKVIVRLLWFFSDCDQVHCFAPFFQCYHHNTRLSALQVSRDLWFALRKHGLQIRTEHNSAANGAAKPRISKAFFMYQRHQN